MSDKMRSTQTAITIRGPLEMMCFCVNLYLIVNVLKNQILNKTGFYTSDDVKLRLVVEGSLVSL